MSKMSEFVIECTEELIRIKPYLTWEEAMNRITSDEKDPDKNRIMIEVFNRQFIGK